MKKKVFLALLTLSFIPITTLSSCNFGNNEPIVDPVEPPVVEAKVYSISFKFNNKKIVGTLSTALSSGSLQLNVDVNKDADYVGDFVLDSSDKSVATISSTGLVTLLKKGETIISGKIGDKQDQFALIVSGDQDHIPTTYTITVVGGTSSVITATEGSYVNLSAIIPDHKKFKNWEFDGEDSIWVNGNSFKMPNRNIVITAVFEDMLYTLNIVGAKVSQAGEQVDPSGEMAGNTHDGEEAEYNITSYQFAYDTPISIEAIQAPAKKLFVGFDYGVINNRVGEMGIPEYGPFTMPDDTLTIWGVFSDYNTKLVNDSVTGVSYFDDANRGARKILDGKIGSASQADPVLEGLSGMRLAIPGSYSSDSDYPENITGTSLDTTNGSATIKMIFRNNHETLPVTIETYATYYGNITTTGKIKIPANTTVTKFFTAGLGINCPWFGFALREAVGASSSDTILLDYVAGWAQTYPEGDKLLQVSGKAEYVSLNDYEAGGSWQAWRPHIVSNSVGLSSVCVYGGNFGNTVNGYLTAKISNLPAFDPENPVTKIYGRIVNNVNRTSDQKTTVKLGVSKEQNPITTGSLLDSQEIVLTKIAEVQLFSLSIPRTADDGGVFYFNIIKNIIDNNDNLWAHNFSIQLVYNNVIGFEEK